MITHKDFYKKHHGDEPFLSQPSIIKLLEDWDKQKQPTSLTLYDDPNIEVKRKHFDVNLGCFIPPIQNHNNVY
jgi:hypothetical protein